MPISVCTVYFNPRAPCGARPESTVSCGSGLANFNPRAPCGARQRRRVLLPVHFDISTHALLAGRDRSSTTLTTARTDFNPRAPCGARPLEAATNTTTTGFQSTRPLRGATSNPLQPEAAHSYFNPRAPCGARQQKCTNHYAHFCDNRQISDVFAQNAACQGILLLFDAGKPCGFWVRTAQVISVRLCFAL